jgi:hypothetical protein
MTFLRTMKQKLNLTTTRRQRAVLLGISLFYIIALCGSISLFMDQTYLRF